jgi:hypothetical protein
MRATSLALLSLAGLALAGCSERDRLTSGAWVCQPNAETRMTMRFAKEDKLEAVMELKEPAATPAPGPVSLKMTLGGQWVLNEGSRLDFAFRSAAVEEATRGGQPLDDSTVGFYRDMFETSPKTATKIVEVSGNKLVYQDLAGGKPVTCSR